MKNLQTYFFESSKLFEFKIKLANYQATADVVDRIKNAVDAYCVETISKPKRLPIQEHREFPQWGPCESWQFDVKLAYPTNTVQIRQALKERAQLNPDWMHVRNLLEADMTDEAEARGKDHEGALLDEEELKADEGGQELAGQARIGSLLKELESRKYDVAGKESADRKTTNDVPQNNTSPVGTKQNTIYRKPRG